MKEQNNPLEKQLSEMEISNLLEKEFKLMIEKMIQNLRKSVEA